MNNQATISLKSYLLRNQIFFNLIIITIAALLIVGVATYIFKQHSEEHLQLISHSLANELEAPLVFQDTAAVAELLKEYRQQYQLEQIIISDLQHHPITLATNEKSPNDGLLAYLQQKLITRQAGFATVHYNDAVINELQIIDSVRPLIYFLKLIGVIFCAWFLLTIASIYLHIRLIYIRITSSLDLLARSTAGLTQKRDFTQRVPMGEIKEFNAISNDFNHLLAELQQWEQNLEQENIKLSHRALHDPLTKLPNREYFHQHLLQLFMLHPPQPFALLYLDNDKFKQVNDNYGHTTGDQLLCAMVERIQDTMNNDYFMARIGGDEFAMILYRCPTPQHALSVVHSLMECQNEPLHLAEHQLDFSFSIGVAFSHQAQSVEMLIHQADHAMYDAKLHPYSKFAFYTPPSPPLT